MPQRSWNACAAAGPGFNEMGRVCRGDMTGNGAGALGACPQG